MPSPTTTTTPTTPGTTPVATSWATVAADMRTSLAAYVAAYEALQGATSAGAIQQATTALDAARQRALQATQLYDVVLRYRSDAMAG